MIPHKCKGKLVCYNETGNFTREKSQRLLFLGNIPDASKECLITLKQGLKRILVRYVLNKTKKSYATDAVKTNISQSDLTMLQLLTNFIYCTRYLILFPEKLLNYSYFVSLI